MQIIWRFYQDARRHWRWEKIGPGYAVVGKSSSSFRDYETCMGDAQAAGYVFQAPRGKQSPTVQRPRRS